MGQWRLMVSAALGLAVMASTPALGQEATADGNILYGDDVAAVPVQPIVMPPLPEDEPPRRIVRRRTDPYQNHSFDDGAFQLRPSLEIGAVASNNVNLSATGQRSDIGLHLKPTLAFQSEWSRHDWHGSVSADLVHYLSNAAADSATGSAETALRLDIRHTTYADFAATASVTSTSAGSQEVPTSATGSRQDWNVGTSAGISHDFGPLQSQLKLGVIRQAYGNVALSGGGTENNADRNYIEPSVALRNTWGAPAALLKPYVELTYNPRLHDQAVDRNGQRRNSQGFGASVGMALNDGPIWTGDVSANFIARSYDDPALRTAMALGLNGSLTWSPTPLWNIVASSGVGLAESELANVSATPSWTIGLNASYQMRDNVTLRSGGNATLSNNVSGVDTTWVASAGAEWQLNPYLSLSGTLQSTWFNAAVASGNYTEQRATVGVVLRP